MGLLGIGLSGLSNSQTALQVTGNNIANADLPSYSRQRVEVETLPEQLRGPGFIGSGSIVSDITRVVDQFLVTQVRLDTASFNSLDIFNTNIDQVDSLLADEFSGLGPAISNFFAAIEASAQDPTSEPSRQVVLAEADGLAQRINTLTSRLLQQSDLVNAQMSSLTTQVSTLSGGIAALNVKIADEIGRSGGGQPNQLLDQRDELLRQLAELVSVTTVQNGNSLDVFIGNGQPLVIGGDASMLGVEVAPNELGNNDITFVDQNGVTQVITSFISGGKLGGLLEFRDDVISDVVNSLGRLSIGLADSLNQQNSLGVDLDGNIGGDIFRDINAGEIPGQRVLTDSNNSDPSNQSVIATIADITQLTTSDYQLNVIDNNADGVLDYQITRKSDNAVTVVNGVALALPTDTQSFTVDGVTITIDGSTQSALANNDRFYIRPTRSGGLDMAVEMTRVQELAYAAPIVTDAASGNVGSGLITPGVMLEIVDDAGTDFAPANPLYSAPGILASPLLIRFTSATDYTMYEASDPSAPEVLFSGTIIPGQNNNLFSNSLTDTTIPNRYLGFQAAISGIPQAGDEFTIEFNANGSSDNRNAVALGAVRKADILDGGSTNFENSYGSLIEEVGTRSAQADVARDAAQSLLLQSQASRDSMSGVNLDEEAANLIKFEQSYNASAQIISIARQIFDTLLGILR
ncbi:flagellar hook-associated protein FlgK [Oceanicoccus sp. KOV_DT_Chl]|uniref:flagellar hook-associated protein FlgK n=1 Tax=Oceanicoccus sp. KOV_DT_Chl TaxID=1904639 RepID=UPI000C799EE9|nr:flagellar hook-associated protein FlgK [Oceanicoccus sp. KOV_DT_Chl]